jgi:hypothetical protein
MMIKGMIAGHGLRAKRKAVQLFYELAFLGGRARAGLLIPPRDKGRLMRLTRLLGGDPGWGRRRHRRMRLGLRARVRQGTSIVPALVLDMSGGGLSLAVAAAPDHDEPLVIAFNGAGTTEYSFPGKVCHVRDDHSAFLVGVRFTAIPLAVCRA